MSPTRIAHVIAGASHDNGTAGLPVHNPATGEITALVAEADSAVVDLAVTAAREAFTTWSATPPHLRARILFRFRDLMMQNLDRLAAIITSEHGKVLDDARGEVIRGVELIEFSCGIPQVLKGEYSENVGRSVDGLSLRQPLGVVAGVVPFNFPAMVPLWMFPIALACGNTFVLKPSEKVPTVALEMAALLSESGLPAGVFNIVQGGRDTVDALIDHPDVEAISFVGSTPVAEYIYTRGTAAGKRVQALGGAKNHMIVMHDADLDSVVTAIMGAAYGSAGERCMAISVVVPVGAETANVLRRRLSEEVRALRVGNGTEPGVEMGPLVSAEHRNKVRGYIESGVEEGADLVVDGREFSSEIGYFLGGTLFDNVTTDMRIHREEIFGPVLSIVRAGTYEEALAIVNDHEFGNGTAIFTRDGGTARAFLADVRAGMVGVNVPIPVPMAFHSFGGWKRSLFGDHHIHGAEGIRFYTRYKTATIRWPESSLSPAQFSMPTHQ